MTFCYWRLSRLRPQLLSDGSRSEQKWRRSRQFLRVCRKRTCFLCSQHSPLFPLLGENKYLTVRQSGLSMTCAMEVTQRVMSIPSDPWTTTEDFSRSMHWATRPPQVKISFTWVSQLENTVRVRNILRGPYFTMYISHGFFLKIKCTSALS